MLRTQPSDHAVRTSIVANLDANFFVEAGAGSGKTTSLVHRMVALVKSGTCSVPEIAAITFTRKAAAELRERFQTELELAYRHEDDPQIRHRLERSLEALHRCFLGTIHSFCARLIRERPIEAGVQPSFQDVQGIELDHLQQQAWTRYLLQVRKDNPSAIARLGALGFGIDCLQQSYQKLLQYQDVQFPRSHVAKPNWQPTLERLDKLLSAGIAEIPDPPQEGRYDNLQEKIRRAHRRLRYFPLDDDARVVQILGDFDNTNFRIVQKLWKDKSRAKETKAAFDSFGRVDVQPLLQRWREHCYQPVLDFLEPAVLTFQEVKQEQGVLDFQDMLMICAQMLRNNPEVRRYFQHRYTRLFVDEFQDTDPIQSEVMFCLTGQDTEETDWRQLHPKPGSLFVVGDPKQAIYRFRRADLDTYSFVKQHLAAQNALVVSLTANFRSVESVGAFCNSVFQGILAGEENPYQAIYAPMETVFPDKPESGVQVLAIPEECGTKSEVMAYEPNMIASAIQTMLQNDSTLQPEDVMILVRYKENIEQYAMALENLGIRCTMAGGTSFAANQEVRELWKLSRALAEPDDRVALVAVLRGLFFGISDQELFDFRTSGGVFHFQAPLREDMALDEHGRVGESFTRLQRYHDWTQRLAPAVALEKILIDTGLLPYALTGVLGRSRCSHLLQALELVRAANNDTVHDWASLVDFLTILGQEGLEEEIRMDPNQLGVRLMNLHKAKGLEADVVFLANPTKKAPSRVDLHVKRDGKLPQGFLRISNRRSHQSIDLALPQNWLTHETEEQQYLSAEEDRLLYVAATRARRLLVISRCLHPKMAKKNPWSPLLETLPSSSDWNSEATATTAIPESCPASDIPEDDWTFVVERLKQPTYVVRSPTGLTSSSHVSVSRDDDGGTEWGNVLHEVLEALVNQETDLEQRIQQALAAHDLPGERIAEVRQVVERFRVKLGRRLAAAKQVLTEVPFLLRVERGSKLWEHLENCIDPLDTVIINGVIDVALEEVDGWTLIDYKSDRVTDQTAITALAQHYQRQVDIYVHAWRTISQQRVKGGSIYFLHSDTVVNVC